MDIAELGIKVDTNDLESATQRLNALKPAAAGAEAAANKLALAVESASVAAASAATKMAQAELKKADATWRAAQASDSASREDIKAAKAATQAARANYSAVAAEEARVRGLNALASAGRKAESAMKAQAAAAALADKPTNRINNASSDGRVSNTPARDQMPNRFNTGNIAAQFQDIGVTAAAGMSPLTVALQQGTQLSAILNSMENPLQGLAAAFKQVINVTSLMSIGFVALLVVLIQAVDWIKVGKSALNGLADAFEMAGPYVAAFAAALALMYSPAIISGLVGITRAVIGVGTAALAAGLNLARAWLIGMGPVGWVIGGIILIVTALHSFRDEVKKIFGVDIIGAIKDSVNKMIGLYVGGFQVIKEGLLNLKRSIKGEDLVDLKPIFDKAMTRDYVNDAVNVVEEGSKKIATQLRSWADSLGDKKKTKKDPWEELVKGAERRISTLNAEAAAVGMTANAAARLKYETDLLNEAQQKNIKLTPQQRDKIAELADTLAASEEKVRKLRSAYDFLKDAAQGFVSDLRSGLAEGKSLWESFGGAVANVLNKIVDKMLENNIANLFASFGSATGGGGGGGFGGILESVGSFLGFSAKGNSFSGSLEPFAKGGAFTNSIVDRATPFKFGGQFGVMGEAGPEAVMPLERGSDGSLGVRMVGNDSNGSSSNPNGGNIYQIDARGTDESVVTRLQAALMALAGPGVIERRVVNAQNRGAL